MDIRNEFDSALNNLLKIGDAFERLHEIRRLQRQNTELNTTCGSCKLWMTKQCPIEAKGKKVSCATYRCSEFSMDVFSKELLNKNAAKIEELKQNNP